MKTVTWALLTAFLLACSENENGGVEQDQAADFAELLELDDRDHSNPELPELDGLDIEFAELDSPSPDSDVSTDESDQEIEELASDADLESEDELQPELDTEEFEELPNVEREPSVLGPLAVQAQTTSVVRAGRTTPVLLLRPTAPGPWPVVIFAPGFLIDGRYYRPLAEHLASHGFATLLATPPGSLFSSNHEAMALDLVGVLEWALAQPWAAEVALSGHSLGGKLAVMAAFSDTRVTAVLALDPVNGAGPQGYTDTRPNIVPSRVAALTIPLGFMGETTNATGLNACAPAEQNFETFFAAATSSQWVTKWDFLGADHMDFVFEHCGFSCDLCTAGSVDAEQLRADVKTLATAFFAWHFEGEARMLDVLTGGLLPAGIALEHR